MTSNKPKQRTLNSLLWETLREEWSIWLWITTLLLIALLFSNQLADWLTNSAFIKFLDAFSKLSVLVAVIAFLREIPKWEEKAKEEAKRRQFEYWKAIDAAKTADKRWDGRFFSNALKIALESLAKEEDAEGKPIKLSSVEADGAKLEEINLEGAYLHVCGFKDADLSGANFRNTQLDVVIFTRARIFGTDFRGSQFLDVGFRHALYDDETKFPVEFNPKKARAYKISPGADLKDAYLENASLWHANLEGANLLSANLKSAIIGGLRSNWKQTNLQNANLKGARAAEIDLRGANLRNANLYQANLQDAKLDGADLQGANFREVRNITIEQIKAAKNWEHAIYDDDFREKLESLLKTATDFSEQ
jgi:uncharacterized protein YjbI with pentapeptide repeats